MFSSTNVLLSSFFLFSLFFFREKERDGRRLGDYSRLFGRKKNKPTPEVDAALSQLVIRVIQLMFFDEILEHIHQPRSSPRVVPVEQCNIA